MKIKHIAAIFVYFVTFTLSVLIVGLPVSRPRLDENRWCREKVSPVASTETDLQVRIRKFLEADHQTGIELANDEARLSQSRRSIEAEKIATFNLVEKMKKVKCDGLPEDFCAAWVEHRYEWMKKASLLDQAAGGKALSPQRFELRFSGAQINESYLKMLAAARKYGVDFKYRP